MLVYAAKKYGIQGLGVTLSTQQEAWARRWIADEGLSGACRCGSWTTARSRGRYDKLVSIGMFEHVGKRYFRTFMAKAHELLKPGGIGLLHTMGTAGSRYPGAWLKHPNLSRYLPSPPRRPRRGDAVGRPHGRSRRTGSFTTPRPRAVGSEQPVRQPRADTRARRTVRRALPTRLDLLPAAAGSRLSPRRPGARPSLFCQGSECDPPLTFSFRCASGRRCSGPPPEILPLHHCGRARRLDCGSPAEAPCGSTQRIRCTGTPPAGRMGREASTNAALGTARSGSEIQGDRRWTWRGRRIRLDLRLRNRSYAQASDQEQRFPPPAYAGAADGGTGRLIHSGSSFRSAVGVTFTEAGDRTRANVGATASAVAPPRTADPSIPRSRPEPRGSTGALAPRPPAADAAAKVQIPGLPPRPPVPRCTSRSLSRSVVDRTATPQRERLGRPFRASPWRHRSIGGAYERRRAGAAHAPCCVPAPGRATSSWWSPRSRSGGSVDRQRRAHRRRRG